MGLFTPWFLAGALAVGLPIWLHLLKKSQQDPQKFPSLMFFEHRETSSVTHRRLDFILLFILRLILLLLLALLFAQPFIRYSTPGAAGDRLTVIAVDRSFSMRTMEGAASRLDLAKTEALSAVGGIGASTKAQVVALSGTLEAMTQQIQDPNELRAAISAIKVGDSRADFGVLARYLRTLHEQSGMPLEVHLVSDLQKTGMPPGFTDLRLTDGTKLVLHSIGKQQPNWSVESVTAPQRLYDPKTAHISATVTAHNAPASKRTASLVLNGKVVSTKEVTVPENGRATADFNGLEASYGFNKCEIRIDGGDTLPADDRYIFSVERTDPKKVLYISDGNHAQSQQFFTEALMSDPDAEYAVEPLRPEMAASADYTKYSVVVLSEPRDVSASLTQVLQRHVERGGGLFLSVGIDSLSMNRVPVIDEAIQGSTTALRTGDRFWAVGDFDPNHPVLRNLERMNGVRFQQSVTLGSEHSRVLARLSQGSPLLLERRIGEGVVLAYAASFDKRQNDFWSKPIYVAFVQEAVKYLGGGGVSQPVNLQVDAYVELRNSGQKEGANAEALDPEGERVLSIEEAASAPNFPVSREGFYDVKNAAGRRMLIAAHPDRRESDLAVMETETQQLWANTGEPTPVDAKSNGASPLNEAQNRWSLAPYLLMLLLLVTLAESVIANRYLRSSVSPQETMTKV